MDPKAAQPERLLIADWFWPTPRRGFGPGAVLLGQGRVLEIACDSRSVRDFEQRADAARLPIERLPDCLLSAAAINAHAHLDLSHLAGRFPPGQGFSSWVRGVVAARGASSPAELEAAWEQGLRASAAGGACAVGDIDSTGAAWRAAPTAGPVPVAVVHVELLDARDPGRLAGQLERLLTLPRAQPGRLLGLSPHAPQTVSDALLQSVGRAAREALLSVQIHWAETPEELDWWLDSSGPFRDWAGPSPARRGPNGPESFLDVLARAGLLQAGTSLVHGNHPRPGEPERLAASGARLIHCPGSHRFFDRPPFPLERFLEAKVPVALGTDSLASNAALDLLREVELLSQAHPALEAQTCWELATVQGARALDGAAGPGLVQAGAPANLLAVPVGARSPAEALERLVRGPRGPHRLWIRGEEWLDSRAGARGTPFSST